MKMHVVCPPPPPRVPVHIAHIDVDPWAKSHPGRVIVVDWFKSCVFFGGFRLFYSLFRLFPSSPLSLIQGLRVTALCGAFGTCIGAWIKVFSVGPDLFYVTFIGQSFVAVSQVIYYRFEFSANAAWRKLIWWINASSPQFASNSLHLKITSGQILCKRWESMPVWLMMDYNVDIHRHRWLFINHFANWQLMIFVSHTKFSWQPNRFIQIYQFSIRLRCVLNPSKSCSAMQTTFIWVTVGENADCLTVNR